MEEGSMTRFEIYSKHQQPAFLTAFVSAVLMMLQG